jgi:hypothetical protein
LAIRRIAVHRHDDDMARFEAKLAGLARLSRGWLQSAGYGPGHDAKPASRRQSDGR